MADGPDSAEMYAESGARVWDSSRVPWSIRRDSSTPLHVQFRHLLLGMIERGDVRSGQPLPTERELADRYRVSLAPVRQAVLDLVREGLLYRVRGQGTFLRERPNIERVSVLSSFSKSMRARGFDVEIHILRQEAVRPPSYVAEALRMTERRILRFERLALIDSEPLALLTSFLSLRTFPGLTIDERSGNSLYDVLEDQFGIIPVHAEMVVEMAPCSTGQSGLFSLPPGSPLLLVEGTTFDEHDTPVEYFRVFYRSDRIRLRFDTHRSAEDVIQLAQSRERRRKESMGKQVEQP